MFKSVYPISSFYFWTDSPIVLCWIYNTETVCKLYVQHRLIRVHKLIDVGNLLLVPSKMNPADIATRGFTPLQLVDNMFWRHGAEFLTLPKTSWPHLHVGDNFNSCNIKGISIRVCTVYRAISTIQLTKMSSLVFIMTHSCICFKKTTTCGAVVEGSEMQMFHIK